MFIAQLHYNVSNDIPLLSLSAQNGKQDEKKKYIYIRSILHVALCVSPPLPPPLEQAEG